MAGWPAIDVVPREEAAAGAGAAEHDDRAHLRELVAHARDERRLLGVDDHDRRVGVVDDVLHLLGVEAVRQRHRDEVALARRRGSWRAPRASSVRTTRGVRPGGRRPRAARARAGSPAR